MSLQQHAVVQVEAAINEVHVTESKWEKARFAPSSCRGWGIRWIRAVDEVRVTGSKWEETGPALSSRQGWRGYWIRVVVLAAAIASREHRLSVVITGEGAYLVMGYVK